MLPISGYPFLAENEVMHMTKCDISVTHVFEESDWPAQVPRNSTKNTRPPCQLGKWQQQKWAWNKTIRGHGIIYNNYYMQKISLYFDVCVSINIIYKQSVTTDMTLPSGYIIYYYYYYILHKY